MNIFMDQDFNVQVLLNEAILNPKAVTADASVDTGSGEVVSEVPGDVLGTGATVKDPLLASWPFVIGISMVTLAISIFLGILLAKRKIKKGFELYED